MKVLLLSSLLMLGCLPTLHSANFLLPVQLHSLPVLVEIPSKDTSKTELGTGFFLNYSNRIFLVTAAHVLFNLDSTNKNELNGSRAVLSYYKPKKNSTGQNVFTVDLRSLLARGYIKKHPSHDVAVMQIGEIVSEDVNGAYQVSYPTDAVFPSAGTRFDSFSAEGLSRKFAEINDGEETYVFGYPAELLNNHMTSEVDFSSPLIRTGIISQRNFKTKKLILDTGIYGGNSGGPVLVIEHSNNNEESYKVAGVVAQFVPVMTRVVPQIGVTNKDLVYSGYSVAEPIDYVLELMKEFK